MPRKIKHSTPFDLMGEDKVTRERERKRESGRVRERQGKRERERGRERGGERMRE